MARNIGQRLLHDAVDGRAAFVVEHQVALVGHQLEVHGLAQQEVMAQFLQRKIQSPFVECARAQVAGDAPQR